MTDPVKDAPIDPAKTISTATPPVTLAVIGLGDGLVNCTTAKTPPDQPNIVIQVVTPAVAILVRAGNVFGVSLIGLLTAAMTPAGSKLLYTSDFYHLLLTCANLSIPIAALGLIKDATTVFSGLEKKFPLASGSV